MRPDQEPLSRDPYWQHDRGLTIGTLSGRSVAFRLKTRLSTERYYEPPEINWFGLGEGERTHVFMRPYLTFPVSSAPRRYAPDPELDALFGLDDPARRVERSIGTASALYEPAIRGLLIRELHLFAPFRPRDPVQDATYQALWLGMEEMLLELLPETRFLVTPRWDPSYPERAYERFLVAVGYLPHLGDERLFMKSLPVAQEDDQPDLPRQRPRQRP
jgi:hypothetical protein